MYMFKPYIDALVFLPLMMANMLAETRLYMVKPYIDALVFLPLMANMLAETRLYMVKPYIDALVFFTTDDGQHVGRNASVYG
jgi:hypothetical protein